MAGSLLASAASGQESPIQAPQPFTDRQEKTDQPPFKPGKVMLHCLVNKDGSVGNCAVTSENPTDQGLGAMALRMAPTFKMKSMTRGGKSAAGSSVDIPITFKLDN